jgi:hypothetical protein
MASLSKPRVQQRSIVQSQSCTNATAYTQTFLEISVLGLLLLTDTRLFMGESFPPLERIPEYCGGVLGNDCNQLIPKLLVPGGGVEPPRPEGRRILSPLRLPVPPSRLFVEVLDSTANFAFYFVTIPNDKCETGVRKCVGFRRFPQLLVPARETLYRRFSGSEPIARS